MIDCHIHYAKSLDENRLKQIIEEYHLIAIALQCIPKGGEIPVEEDSLRFKENCSIPVYVFGGIDRSIYSMIPEKLSAALPAEITRLKQMGCAGIKMLEGKPNIRKDYPIPDFDSMVWDAYWDKIEQEQFPVLMHVNDPEEFWQEDKVSEFAKQAGWYYDSSYINNEDQYKQVLNVLDHHKKLKIIFPHFFFLSNDLERLSTILDRYENVKIDITPGAELYYNLSRQHKAARQFFDTYQDRICYGTDIGGRSIIRKDSVPLSLEESRARIALITRFLEEPEDYIQPIDGYYIKEGEATLMHGLSLPPEQLKKIYETNFLDFLSIK